MYDNPVNGTDPTGHLAFLVILLIAVIVGAVAGAIGAAVNGAKTWHATGGMAGVEPTSTGSC